MLILTIVFGLLVITAVRFSIPPLKVPAGLDKNARLARLDEWLSSLHRRKKFSGVVLLAANGKIIFEKGYGYADTSGKDKLTVHSSFNLASVSKQFTAAGIVLLKCQDKLSYSDAITKFIPELKSYSGVSIQHLLHHTSGIPDYLGVASKHLNASELVTVPKLIALYARNDLPLRFTPGDKFEYSNMGYVLLAEIIERASGQAFSEFMAENFFRPLEMKHTQVFNLLSEEAPKNRVHGFRKKYRFFGGKQLHDLNHFDGVAGDGSVYASAYDLLKWHSALLKGTVIPIEEMKVAYQSGILNNDKKMGYGFGWFVNEDGSVEHPGGWQGFATYFFRNEQKDLVIVVLDNSGNLFRVTPNGGRYNSIPINLKHFLEQL